MIYNSTCRTVITAFVVALLTVVSVVGQTPPPPPPEDKESAEKESGPNIDLSKVPIPEADKKLDEVLTEEERKGPKISLTIMPVGFVPPPIIYLDKAGMPREKYRNPLEYAPAVYHVKTKRGTIKLTGAQNNLGAGNIIPKISEVTLYSEKPIDPNADSDTLEKGPRLSKIGTFRVPAEMTHGLVVLTKDPQSKYWRNIKLRLIDMSPGKYESNEVIVINMSGAPMALGQGKEFTPFMPGTVRKHALGEGADGNLYYIVAAEKAGGGWQQIMKTGNKPRPRERIIFASWPAPKSKVIPTGAEITRFRYMPKQIPRPKRRVAQ